jgi:uncharacterized protein (TIGR03086 family)
MSFSEKVRRTDMEAVDLSLATRLLADLVDATSDADLAKSTPCPEFTVADLLDHVRGFSGAFAAAGRKERGPLNDVTPSSETSPLQGDWRAEIRQNLDNMAAAWTSADAWSGTTRIAGMDSPAEMVGCVGAEELLVHTWDLTMATGRDFSASPSPEILAAARHFLDATADADRPSGTAVAFGPPTTAPVGASELEQAIALAGRDVRWTPR